LRAVGWSQPRTKLDVATMSTLSNQRPRILVVDDDETVSGTIERALRVAGYEVKTAGSGEDALSELEHATFDLIILDYLMPVMTGEKVAANIRTQTPDQRIIMITAYTEMLKASGDTLKDIDCVVSKPFSLSDLLDNVATVLKKDSQKLTKRPTS
jgi:CheY-like chemotaxis protein